MTSHTHSPQALLALTMGDACGVGPEIIAKWWRKAGGAAVVVGFIGVLIVVRPGERHEGP